MKTNINILKRKYVFVTILFLGFIVVLNAAEKANFSGKWVLNKEKSELGERSMADNVKTIKQESNKLTVERKFSGMNGEEMTSTDNYTLDGKECLNKGFGDSERKSFATWSEDGKNLTIKSSVKFNRNGEERIFESTEIWTLSDGNLIITSTSQRGERKMVYDLQK